MAVSSSSNTAKRIIRREISSFGWNSKRLKSQINYNGDTLFYGSRRLVQDGNFAVYHDDTEDMLNKIYGKSKVKTWSNEKKWNTYKNLVSREIVSIVKNGRMALGSRKGKR